MEIIQYLTGPNGGICAIAFAAGYMFCQRTLLRDAKSRIEQVEQEIKEMRRYYNEQLNELRGKYEEELRTPSIPAHMIGETPLDS
jgi:hypothetical protein